MGSLNAACPSTRKLTQNKEGRFPDIGRTAEIWQNGLKADFAAVAQVLSVRKSAMRNEADPIVGVANGGFSNAEIVTIRIRVEIRRAPRVRKIITTKAPADIQLIAYMARARGVESCGANAVQDLVERTFCRG